METFVMGIYFLILTSDAYMYALNRATIGLVNYLSPVRRYQLNEQWLSVIRHRDNNIQ